MTEAAAPARPVAVKLSLYVTGATGKSRRAIENLKRFCDSHLDGQYELEIVDLYREPARAREAQIVASPTLIRSEPSPRRLAIGDLSDTKALQAMLIVA